MLDFRMETFLALCRTMNYTRAAEELRITQPAVTQHIQYLQRHYGVKLFSYHDKRLALTEAGEALHSAALTMEHDERELRQRLPLLEKGRQHLRLGATLTVGEYALPPHLARYMKRQRSGSIVNTSSVTAQFGTQMGTPYSASKAAILGITRSLAMELAPWNVRVNAVAPGVVNTEMVSNLNEQERESCARSIPLARLGEPRDIANAMLFLASDMASYITGSTLNVDGGYRPAFVPLH